MYLIDRMDGTGFSWCFWFGKWGFGALLWRTGYGIRDMGFVIHQIDGYWRH